MNTYIYGFLGERIKNEQFIDSQLVKYKAWHEI